MSIPKQLLPVFRPDGPRPRWLSPVPAMCFAKDEHSFTLDPVVYHARDGRVWTVPAGLFNDGMSYPWPLRLWWDPFDPRTLRTAVLHDFRYAMHDYFPEWSKIDTRKDADRDLLDGLRLDCPSRATPAFIGVRFGGQYVYDRDGRETELTAWLSAIDKGCLPEYMAMMCRGSTKTGAPIVS